MDGNRSKRMEWLGNLAKLDDALLLQLMAEYLDVDSLVRLSAASRFLYALASIPSVWRDHYLEDFKGNVEHWCETWRATYVYAAAKQHAHRAALANAALLGVSCRGVYSDAIYHSFITASFEPRTFLEEQARREARKLHRFRKVATDTPPERASICDTIVRISEKDTTCEAFQEGFAEKSVPCIVVDATDDWPCRVWTLDYVHKTWPKRIFQAEAARMDASTYAAYAQSCTSGKTEPDTSPLYLFDAEFAADESDAKNAWRVPKLLSRFPGQSSRAGAQTCADLFSLYGSDRPDYRWLIAGPEKSGSGWHKDPNMTSAWNAVMQGAKYWMLLPPDTVPPGVYVSKDQAEVTAPASLSEWMLDFYDETKRRHGRRELGGDGKLVEAVCRTGEVMYIPSGWWHLVVNLDTCVALTQNFVSVTELPAVLSFMHRTPDQISGFKGSDAENLQRLNDFVEKLEACDPALAKNALAKMPSPPKEHVQDTRDWRERLGAAQHHVGWSIADAVGNEELGDVPW
ncbi:hypothetical protein MVES_002540 [Malassezia vespertilionis]|uniref:JmjC domain-containing protein n=2 Tax=Malassezia vespertilionis TaxID=2020962 RepID=A0A2N1JB07_9BASI|nr:hypothetical protein MVES_002540 [Malassezia vespertilionis]